MEPAHVPEVPRPGESPFAYAQRLAEAKAFAVIERLSDGYCALGADTVVVLQDQVLEKPADPEDAKRMLRMLSSREHRVITGVCLAERAHNSIQRDVRAETTRVWMNEIGEEDIEAYVATGEPMDKAGAYAIQGIASRWIPRIEGCYFNVVGLPVPLVYRMLRENGCLEIH